MNNSDEHEQYIEKLKKVAPECVDTYIDGLRWKDENRQFFNSEDLNRTSKGVRICQLMDDSSRYQAVKSITNNEVEPPNTVISHVITPKKFIKSSIPNVTVVQSEAES